MDVIEKLFHFAPDGGSGMTEAAFVVVALVAAGVVAWSWRRRTTRKS
jgi:hypothetical protein